MQEKLQAFYTGGVVRFSSDGRHMFCTCGSAVNVVELSSLAVKQTMEEVKTRERERCTCISVCVGGGYSDIAGSVTRRQHGCGGLEELAGETVSVADLMHTLSSVEGQPVEIEVTFNCAVLSRTS